MSEENQQEQSVEPTPIETEARAQGWVPKEEFRGNESDWIDAEVFVQRGREINPILRKNNERIQKELEGTKRQLEELKRATEEFKQFQKESYAKKLAEYEVEIKELKTLKSKAVSDGEGDLVVEIDDQIADIKAKQAAEQAKVDAPDEKPAPVQDPQVTSEIETWVSENSWYKTDARMAAATNAIADQIRKTNPYLVGKEFLDKVDEQLADMFTPEKLGKKTRPRSPVSGSQPTTENKSGKKSYDNLPPEAKAACDKFVKQKLMTRDEYIAAYDFS